MATITVNHRSGAIYDVTVEDGGGRTSHAVSVTPAHLARFAPNATPEALLKGSFEFLLEREPKEAILARFELPVIERYFPDYPQALAARLAKGAKGGKG